MVLLESELLLLEVSDSPLTLHLLPFIFWFFIVRLTVRGAETVKWSKGRVSR